jgi:hypothetical protein
MKPYKKSLRLAIARDIKAGITFGEVLQKYTPVSAYRIRKLSEVLAREKLISEKEFDNFRNTERKAVDTKLTRKANDSTTVEDTMYLVLDSQRTKQELVDSKSAATRFIEAATDKASEHGSHEQASSSTRPSGRVNVHFTADTHFGSETHRKYFNRPFPDVWEMARAIIKNWNAVVGEKDIVYHLGDFGIGEAHVRGVFRRLHGYKILIAGNHDPEPVLCLPWADVAKSMEINCMVIAMGEGESEATVYHST